MSHTCVHSCDTLFFLYKFVLYLIISLALSRARARARSLSLSQETWTPQTPRRRSAPSSTSTWPSKGTDMPLICQAFVDDSSVSVMGHSSVTCRFKGASRALDCETSDCECRDCETSESSSSHATTSPLCSASASRDSPAIFVADQACVCGSSVRNRSSQRKGACPPPARHIDWEGLVPGATGCLVPERSGASSNKQNSRNSDFYTHILCPT